MTLEFIIIRRRLLKCFESAAKKDTDRVLDLGCGQKPYYHSRLKGKIVCFDKLHTKKAHIIGDADYLPFKNNSFDKAVSVNSLYYFKNPFNVAGDIARVLRKNGQLILVMPFIYPIHDAPDDKYRFTKYGIMELLKNNFDIKQIKAIGGIFNLPAVFFHSLIKGLPLMAPKYSRGIVKLFCIILFYPFYLLAQLLSILDFIDISGRWATYYFVVAVKK